MDDDTYELVTEILKMDTNGDGKIDYNEFLNYCDQINIKTDQFNHFRNVYLMCVPSDTHLSNEEIKKCQIPLEILVCVYILYYEYIFGVFI